ncbi:hypothetical protein NMG60_11017019 [Bertholletia excelsa]
MTNNLPVFDVAPLNAVPYIDPQLSQGKYISSSNERETQPKETGPAVTFKISQQSGEEMEVELTGTAAMVKGGPLVGLLDIGECGDAYIFRVSLPGVRVDPDFRCCIQPSGKTKIEGVTTTGEKHQYRKYNTFQMLSANLCPPGYFSVSFQLPGPVDHLTFSGYFGTDGILEGIVKKAGSSAAH